MIKKLFSLIIILLVIATGAAGAVWTYASTILARGTEKALSYALQVDVKVGDIQLHPLDGNFEIGDLVIGNPDGFNTRSAFQIRRATVTADLASFRTEEPTISLIEIVEPKVTLEKGLRTSNLKELISNASRFQSGESQEPGEVAPEEAPDAAKKKLKIEKVIIDGTEVALSAPILRGQEVVFPVSRLELDDIGEEKERVGIAEFLKITINKILTAALSQGSSVIPEGFDTFGAAGTQAVEGVKQGLSGASGGLKGLLGRD